MIIANPTMVVWYEYELKFVNNKYIPTDQFQ